MNGLLIQWGTITTDTDQYKQNFTISFSNGCSPLLVTDYITTSTPGNNGMHPNALSNTSFTMIYKHSGGCIKWLAIGY